MRLVHGSPLRQGTLYREQWDPLQIDTAYRKVATDELGCTLFGRMNGVKVRKMRWLGMASIDKEYPTIVVYLDNSCVLGQEGGGGQTACKDDSRDGKWRVCIHSAIRSGTSASKMLPLPPLCTSILSLQGANSYLWILCTSWPLCFDLYFGRS